MSTAPLLAYVVEDNASIRENLVGALEELADVRVVGSSGTEDEAAGWLQSHTGEWQLAIVDLFLKQGSGLQLVQRMAGRSPRHKVVVFSNYVNSTLRKRCAQLGVDAVFDKSTEIDSLVDYCARLAYELSGATGREAL